MFLVRQSRKKKRAKPRKTMESSTWLCCRRLAFRIAKTYRSLPFTFGRFLLVLSNSFMECSPLTFLIKQTLMAFAQQTFLSRKYAFYDERQYDHVVQNQIFQNLFTSLTGKVKILSLFFPFLFVVYIFYTTIYNNIEFIYTTNSCVIPFM